MISQSEKKASDTRKKSTGKLWRNSTVNEILQDLELVKIYLLRPIEFYKEENNL